MQREDRTFRSRLDPWLAITFAVADLVMVAAGAFCFWTRDPAAIAIGIALLAAAGFISWTLAATNYTFSGGDLILRSAAFRWRLKVADIVSATPSKNPASGPALSLDRLALYLRGGHTLMISPLDKEGFLAELEARKAA